MEPLPPIPVGFATRCREFRTRTLPLLALIGTAAAAAWLWMLEGSARAFPGVAEGIRAAVTSPQAGALQQLLVRPYQMVDAGSPVAVVLPTDPRAKLDLWQAELELARLSLQPSLAEENAVDFERLRLELLRTRSEVATAQVDLELAENQVRRQTALHKQKLISEDLYDLTVKARDSLRAEVHAKSNAVAQIEERLTFLRSVGEPEARAQSDPSPGLISRLEARQTALATNWGPVTLLAPVSGMVSGIYRQPGEHVTDGEPLLTINSPYSDRVVGYLRQPYPSVPEPGMSALLTTREWKRSRYIGMISQIGAQVEFITNSLALIRPGALVDAGLPVVIHLPPHAKIRPGEIVDVQIQVAPDEGNGLGADGRPHPGAADSLESKL